MTVLSSKIFNQYFLRFNSVSLADLASSNDADEDSRRTLLYMMATLRRDTREEKLENGVRLEDAVYNAYKICYRLNISPYSLKTIHGDHGNAASVSLMDNITKNIAQPWKTSFLNKHLHATSLNINHTKDIYLSLLRAHTQHEVLHKLIRAPFNQYGEVFTVAVSNVLELDLDARSEWKQFSNIIVNSKFIQVDWKKKFFAFKDVFSKDDTKQELKQELKTLTGSILSGKHIKPTQIKPWKHLVPTQ